MKKKSMNLVTAVAVLVVLSGTYVGVKTYVTKQEEKENASEDEEKTQVFSIASDDVKSIKFVIDKKEVTFEKDNDEWVKTDEKDFPVDQDKLTEAIGSLDNIEADRVLDDVTDATEYGLDNPTNTITITDNDGNETALRVGMENDSTSQYYVEKGEDESKIYVVADSVFQFGHRDRGNAQFILQMVVQALQDLRMPAIDRVGNHVGVQHVSHRSMSSESGRSSIGCTRKSGVNKDRPSIIVFQGSSFGTSMTMLPIRFANTSSSSKRQLRGSLTA